MIGSQISAGLFSLMADRFAEVGLFSAESTPTGKLQRAKTFFGAKEKLLLSRARRGAVIAERSFGSLVSPVQESRRSPRHLNASCSIAPCTHTCSTETTSVTV